LFGATFIVRALKLCFVLLCSEKLWNLPTQIDCILLPRSERFPLLQTKATQINEFQITATQINCILFCRRFCNLATKTAQMVTSAITRKIGVYRLTAKEECTMRSGAKEIGQN
jgi:hypothetical protein